MDEVDAAASSLRKIYAETESELMAKPLGDIFNLVKEEGFRGNPVARGFAVGTLNLPKARQLTCSLRTPQQGYLH